MISNWELLIIDAYNRFMERIHHKNIFIQVLLSKNAAGIDSRWMGWETEWMDGCMGWMLLSFTIIYDVFGSLIGLLLVYKWFLVSLFSIWIMLFRWPSIFSLYIIWLQEDFLLMTYFSFFRFQLESWTELNENIVCCWKTCFVRYEGE